MGSDFIRNIRKYGIFLKDSPFYFTPHFRHSRAMHWLEAGIDMEYIKDLLGHEDMETVRTYARLSLKMKDEALKKAQSETKNDADSSQESWTKDQSLVDWLKSFKKLEPSTQE